MRKCNVVGLGLCALLISSGANAEVTLGIEAGVAEVDGLDDNGTEVGVFGRFMSSDPSGKGFGLHVGYAQNSAEDSAAAGNVTANGEIKNIIDVLLAFRSGASDASGVHAFFMAGYSRAEVDISGSIGNASFSDSYTADGWKAAVGIENPISENAVFSLLLYYANYGDLETSGTTTDLDAGDSYGIRAGIAYRF